MGEASPAGPERPRTANRSIRFTFAVRVVVPAVALGVVWVLAVSIAFGTVLSGRGLSLRMQFAGLSHRELAEFALLIAVGLIIIAGAVAAVGLFARQLAREITSVSAAARQLADEQSAPPAADPSSSARTGARSPGTPSSAPTSGAPTAATAGSARGQHAARPRSAEAAQATTAIAQLQHAATAAAASEAALRDGLRQVIVSLSRRNQSLLQRQLRLIDTLEQKAADPTALAELFSLDHLTTRMRRHAESLAILSGSPPARSWREPVPVIDVIRGAMAEVEDYTRVTVLTQTEDAIAGSAAADMIHLLAELIENATMFSPSGTPVEIRASRVANGFIVEIDDRGLGIDPEQLLGLNQQLATPPDFDLANADRIGLFVGAKLAARYGVRVALRPSPYGGITAIVLMPVSIVVPALTEGMPAAPAEARPRPGTPQSADRPARLDLRGAGALALVGSRSGPTAGQPPGPPLPGQPPSLAQPSAPALSQPAAAQPAPGPPGLTQPPLPQPRIRPSAGLPRRAAGEPGAPAADGPAAFRPPAAPLPVRASSASAPPAAPAPAPPAAAAPPGVVRPPVTGTYRGLPRRTRQASLSPHLRDAPAAPSPASAAGADLMAAPVAPRAPEEARDLAASLQGGWRRGRQAPDPDVESGPGTPAGESDPATPQSEEA